jgi:hypothetical protein
MNVQQETRQYLASRLQGITTMTALTIESFAIAGFIILEFPLIRTGQTADYVPILQCHINEQLDTSNKTTPTTLKSNLKTVYHISIQIKEINPTFFILQQLTSACFLVFLTIISKYMIKHKC